MADHDQVQAQESTHTIGLIQFPGLDHPHFRAPIIQTSSEPEAPHYQCNQLSSFYSCRVEGSYKRRCIEYRSVRNYRTPTSYTCTLEAEIELIADDPGLLCRSSTLIPTSNASTSPRTCPGEAILESQGAYLPDASFINQKSSETLCSPRTEAGETITDDVVCYGQLNNFCEVRWPLRNIDYSCISWHGGDYLSLGCHEPRTNLPERALKILTALSSTAGALFDFAGTPSVRMEKKSAQQCKESARAAMETVHVHLVIYAAKTFAEDIGLWLDDMGLFLQLPTHSKQDVLYHNPHAMYSSSGIVTTRQLRQTDLYLGCEKLPKPILPCEDIFTHKVYKEAQQPVIIRSTLKPHQLQALTFMQGRELGWDLENERETNDLWRCEVDVRGRTQYRIALSSESRYKPPVEFRGGLLADEMGLGKTCTMLSMIAAGLQDAQLTQSPTLIVVPLPVLQVWEKQINLHFQPHSIVFTIYYKPIRGLLITFDSCNIVITTYNTVSKEWKAQKKSSDTFISPLFSTCWHRIVLDEAHVIKNKDTDIAKAVCTLRGERRWCMTGTPIQNRSSDLYSLLKFLRVYPYDDYRTFETTFVEPWTQRHDDTALRRFQTIMATIAIRRPRSTIKLPERRESICDVDFSPAETEVYEQAKTCASDTINDAVKQSKNSTSGAAYLNALQRINDLRYICNHGTQPRVKKQKVITIDDDDVLIEKELQAWIGETVESSAMCNVCGYDLVEAQEGNESLTVQNYKKQLKSCPSCDSRLETVSPSNSSAQTSSPEPSTYADDARSSKIRRLVSEVLNIDRVDKCVVFSYWTSTLKSISQAFMNSGIEFLMYDGSMSRTKRHNILHQFKQSTTIRAILVSISCGGQGLDLTAANHAFLVEPQWNPMLEEQAMARVHRLGQKKQVNLVRMIVKGTFEENIVRLQKRKRLLADLIVDNQKMDKREEVHKHLMQLRDLVS